MIHRCVVAKLNAKGGKCILNVLSRWRSPRIMKFKRFLRMNSISLAVGEISTPRGQTDGMIERLALHDRRDDTK